MKYFSKYPVFFTLLILLLVAFVGLTAYNIYLFNANSTAAKKEKGATTRFVNAVNRDPGEESLAAAKSNIASLQERLQLLEKDLSRDSSKILAPSPVKEGYQLNARLLSMVQQWTNEANQKGIGLPSDYLFSFKKYLDASAKPPVDAAVEPLWRQASILDNIMKKLFASKIPETPLNIVSVQREILPVEIEEEKAAAAASGRRSTRPAKVIRSNTGDTFEVDEAISARKEGNLEAIGYRIVFTSYSDVMHRFLNELNGYDLMLVVRSIEVKPTVDATPKAATPAVSDAASFEDAFSTALESDDSSFGTEQKSTAVSKDPVVSENLSEFTIIIEFVEIAKEAPKTEKSEAEEGEGE